MDLSNQRAALRSLVTAVDALKSNDPVSLNDALGQVVTDALAAITQTWLCELLALFGWKDGCFTQSVDVKVLSNHLKLSSLVLVGVHKTGFYTTVCTVRCPCFWRLEKVRQGALVTPEPAQGHDGLTGELITVRVLKPEQQEGVFKRSAFEVEQQLPLLQELQHPNIVRHVPHLVQGAVLLAPFALSWKKRINKDTGIVDSASTSLRLFRQGWRAVSLAGNAQFAVHFLCCWHHCKFAV